MHVTFYLQTNFACSDETWAITVCYGSPWRLREASFQSKSLLVLMVRFGGELAPLERANAGGESVTVRGADV